MKLIYLTHSSIKSTLFLICCLSLFSLSSFSQSGCTNSNACNYDNTAVFDDGSCSFYGYFIPGPGVVGPAVRACVAPEGYIFPNQICVLNIIIEDDYCLVTEWDDLCQAAYEECLGCAPTVFIPAIGVTGPAVIGCSPPEGYIYPDQDCATTVIANDPFCLNTNWDSLCNDAYTNCAGCSPVVWIPIAPTTGPAVISCFMPPGYGPTYQEVIAIILSEIPSCLENWDADCQLFYEIVLEGCSPNIYIPEIPGSGTAIMSCSNAPIGYESSYQIDCAYSTILNDYYCLTTSWDVFCNDAYNLCTYGCANPGCDQPLACNYNPIVECGFPSFCQFDSWYIPTELGVSLPIFSCEAPEGYVQASAACMLALQSIDPYCFESNWDAICQLEYDACLSGNFYHGCSYLNAVNYDINAVIDDGSCIFELSSCTGDLNGDLVINTADLNAFLSVFGTSCF